MKLSRKDWNKYVSMLSAINKTAGRKMQAWIDKNGTEDVEALVEYAYALTTKYGEASSALACQMYDEIAAVQKANVPPAEPKMTQNVKYVDKAIRSTMDRAPNMLAATVSEMVKRTGAETTLKNALRDGAYFAWVPNGDTCAFCMTLASNGWRRASRKTINGDHAEHIHKNCDCEFAISFNGPGQIEGYDPDKYLQMYENAEGEKWKDKVNSMRRAQYAVNKDYINAQKRAAYALRMERQRGAKAAATVVDMKQIGSQSYRMQFHGITGDAKVDDRICEQARTMLEHRSGTEKEDLALIDAKTGNLIHLHDRSDKNGGVGYDDLIDDAIKEAHGKGQKIIAIHNHPNSLPPTMDDGASAYDHGYDIGVVVGHDGSVFQYTKTNCHYEDVDCTDVHKDISYQIKTGAKLDDVWYSMLEEYGMTITRR